MANIRAFGVACLLILGMYAPAFGASESPGGNITLSANNTLPGNLTAKKP